MIRGYVLPIGEEEVVFCVPDEQQHVSKEKILFRLVGMDHLTYFDK